jgi:hypothetical protein
LCAGKFDPKTLTKTAISLKPSWAGRTSERLTGSGVGEGVGVAVAVGGKVGVLVGVRVGVLVGSGVGVAPS